MAWSEERIGKGTTWCVGDLPMIGDGRKRRWLMAFSGEGYSLCYGCPQFSLSGSKQERW